MCRFGFSAGVGHWPVRSRGGRRGRAAVAASDLCGRGLACGGAGGASRRCAALPSVGPPSAGFLTRSLFVAPCDSALWVLGAAVSAGGWAVWRAGLPGLPLLAEGCLAAYWVVLVLPSIRAVCCRACPLGLAMSLRRGSKFPGGGCRRASFFARLYPAGLRLVCLSSVVLSGLPERGLWPGRLSLGLLCLVLPCWLHARCRRVAAARGWSGAGVMPRSGARRRAAGASRPAPWACAGGAHVARVALRARAGFVFGLRRALGCWRLLPWAVPPGSSRCVFAASCRRGLRWWHGRVVFLCFGLLPFLSCSS